MLWASRRVGILGVIIILLTLAWVGTVPATGPTGDRHSTAGLPGEMIIAGTRMDPVPLATREYRLSLNSFFIRGESPSPGCPAIIGVTNPTICGVVLGDVVEITATWGGANHDLTIKEFNDLGSVVAATPTKSAPTIPVMISFTATVSQYYYRCSIHGSMNGIILVSTPDAPPVAEAGLDQTATTGQTVALDGSGSSDDNGIVNWTWAWDDGGLVSAFGETVMPSFSSGVHVVNLTVTDAAAQSDSDLIVITVNPYYEVSVAIGLNLISIPTDAFGSPDVVFNDSMGDGATSWQSAFAYDSVNGIWLSHVKSRPSFHNSLLTVDGSSGIWVNVTSLGDGQLTIPGSAPGPQSLPLGVGWHLVGFPSLAIGETVGSAFSTVTYDRIEGSGIGTHDFVVLNSTVTIGPGDAVWIRVTSTSIWDVPA